MRRRLAVLAGLLAIIAIVVLIVVRPGSNSSFDETEQVKVPEDLTETSQGDDETEDEDSDEVPACETSALEVTAVTDAASYGPDEEPMLSLTVENTGEEGCAADLGTASMVFEITSGTDQIWRSTDCQQDADHRTVLLKPGEAETTEPIPWNRERSGTETCDIEREKVVAGGASYHLSVTISGVTSRSTAQFQLY